MLVAYSIIGLPATHTIIINLEMHFNNYKYIYYHARHSAQCVFLVIFIT